MNSVAETTAFFGANRSGKTVSGAVKAIFHATGRYPEWWTARRFTEPTTGRIFAQDYKKGARTVIKKLRQWLPKDAYFSQPKKGSMGVEIEWDIKHVSGGVSHFDIMTYESDPFSAEGWDGDWVWFDEPPPRDMYIAAVRGLVDNEGLCWFSLTPLKEPWLFDEIYSSKNENVFSVICDMRHNLARVNPLSGETVGLSETAIRKFEMKLTEEERETRAHGKFRYLAGRIWKEWDREVHTFDRFKEWPLDRRKGIIIAGEPPIHWPRAMFLDPHDRLPHALLWVVCDEAGDYWAYREAWLGDALLEDVVRYCKKVEVPTKERILVRVLDPNFGPKRYGNSGLTVRDEIEKAGRDQQYPMRFVFGNDNKELGRKEFSALLRFDHSKPVSFINHPKFRAANDLKEFVYQLEHYIWDDYKSAYDRDPKETPKQINTHYPDLCHYLALSKFERYKPVIVEGVGNFYGRG
jgi:phage terminase large subunit-like protein